MDEELDLVVFEDDEGNEITMEVLDISSTRVRNTLCWRR